MSTNISPTSVGTPRTRVRRVTDRALARLLKLPPATHDFTTARDLRIPMRDGADLLADHLAPVGTSRGTILIRGPYGFNALGTTAFGGFFARYGYDVVLARTRGTFGSAGEFDPFVREIDDAQDTVAWLRQQPFFTGTFATYGGSYLGFTQWALLMDPPPELATSIMQVAPHDVSKSVYKGGSFNLELWLAWADQVANQEDVSLLKAQVREATAVRRHAPVQRHLPLTDAVHQLTDSKAPWFRDFVTRRDLADPFWSRMQLGAALDRVTTPVLLQTGWQDIFLDQSLEQYARLRDRGVEVGLTIGPWTHQATALKGYATLVPEALDWLTEHLNGTGTPSPAARVRLQITGTDEWRDFPTWPPPARERVLHPQPGGRLDQRPAPVDAAPATFTYDPADPTPSIGGLRFPESVNGYQDDCKLAERADVLTFTGPPLETHLETIGVPVVELSHTSNNAHPDLFVRVSDVDPKGRSQNVSDGFAQLTPAHYNDGVVRLELDAIAHRFNSGHRIRLCVSGGSFPQFERNLGSDADPATSTTMSTSHHTIDVVSSRLLLPVVGPTPKFDTTGMR